MAFPPTEQMGSSGSKTTVGRLLSLLATMEQKCIIRLIVVKGLDAWPSLSHLSRNSLVTLRKDASVTAFEG